MSNNKTSLTRKVETQLTDNGTPFAYSMTSHKNIKVNAEVQPPLQLPGLIIFVHGVNSEGEWYNNAEVALCSGLNQRLGLQEQYSLLQMNIMTVSSNLARKIVRNGQHVMAMIIKKMDISSS
jgi:hypothetical protein